MKVRLYGFEVEAMSNSVSINNLFESLENTNGDPDKTQNIERRIYIDSKSNSNYYLGLVVTVKDQKRFCKLEDDRGNVKITVENLKGEDKLMEFNFFVLNKKNGIGIFQHYFQSCSINVFGGYLRMRYKILREEIINNEINKNKSDNSDTISDKIRKKINKKHKGNLKFTPLFRKEDLADILEEFKRIKAFEFEYSTLVINSEEGVPLNRYVSKKREKLTFSQDAKPIDLIKDLIPFIKKNEPQNGRIFVLNQYDEDLSIKINDNPSFFGEDEYDDVTLKLNDSNVNNLKDNKIIKELLDTCKSEKFNHIFEANIK